MLRNLIERLTKKRSGQRRARGRQLRQVGLARSFSCGLQFESLEQRVLLAGLTVAGVDGITSVIEGDALTFAVTLDDAVPAPFTVDVTLADVTATGGAAPLAYPHDYDNVVARLNFSGTAGETQQFTVATLDDAVVEVTETFAVSLNASNSQIDAAATVTGTIMDNDRATLSVGSATVVEGDGGTTLLSFPVTLDAAIDVDVSVDYTTQDGTASAADGDYVAVTTPATLTIKAGDTSGTINVTVNGDTTVEADEILSLLLVNLRADDRHATLASADWVQSGGDIDGEAMSNFGAAVSLSSDGKTLAVGAPWDKDLDGVVGHARVLRFHGGRWQQLGQDIVGEAFGDGFGTSISLSDDGNTVAIGAPRNEVNGVGHARVFRFDGEDWVQLGQHIDGKRARVEFGVSISLSGDGQTIAVGAVFGSNAVFRFDGTQWVQLGAGVGLGLGPPSRVNLPVTLVSLDRDGDTLVIGRPNAGPGRTRVYRYVSENWAQLGPDIDGEAAGDAAGSSVSLSDDGDTVLIGAPFNDGGGRDAGQARVYLFDGSNWAQRGSDIDGVVPDGILGASVSLSGDGRTVLIGAPYHGSHFLFTGQASVYRFDGFRWTRVGQEIEGDAALEQSGVSVSLSGDASILTVGTPRHLVDGKPTGMARVYRLQAVATGTIINDDRAALSVGNATVTEGDSGTTMLSFPVTLDAAVDVDVSVDYTTHDGTATAADGDYVAVTTPATLTIKAGDTSGTINITVNGDTSIEPNETIGLRLSNWQAGDRDVTLALADWVQFGQDINGDAVDDRFGRAVSLSGDGRTLALGAQYNGTNGGDAGQVRVYRFDGIQWFSLGLEINGEVAYEQSGNSISLSGDGNTLAIGALSGGIAGKVRIYRFDGTNWIQFGEDINGETGGDQFGYSVSLSSDGNTLAVGARFNDENGDRAGSTRVYEFGGANWSQLGSDIDGEAADDEFGYSVSLSGDGETLAVGAPRNGANGDLSGHARVYRFDGSTWSQLGEDIDGKVAGEQFGYSVSLSGDGSTLAVGAPFNGGGVRAYVFDGTDWKQRGKGFDSDLPHTFSGWSVSLSADGNTVAVGRPAHRGNGTLSGSSRIYRFNGVEWGQFGQGINGEASHDLSGFSVSLSGDGNTLAIGAPGNLGYRNSAGQARVYGLGVIGTINDNDSILVEFNQPTGTDAESSGENLPQLLVTGTIQEGHSVTISLAAGGTADAFGVDYTAPATVTIPAGTYNATTVPINALSISPDLLIGIDETIDLEILSGSQVRVGDANGDGTIQATTRYTIIDDNLQSVRTTVDVESVLTVRDVVPGGKDDQLELTIVGNNLVITDRNNILGDFTDNTTGTVVSVPLDLIDSIAFDLSEGDDQLTIDFSGAPQGLSLSVIVNGGDGHDTLTFSGPMLLGAGGLQSSDDVEDVFVNGPIAIQDGTIRLNAVQSLEVNADITIAAGSIQLKAGRDIFGNCSLIQAGDADVHLMTGTGIANVRVQTTGDVALDAGSGGIVGCPDEISVRARTLTLTAGTSVGTAIMMSGRLTHEAPLLTSVDAIQGTVGGMGIFLVNDGPLTDNVLLTAAPPMGIRHVCPGPKCELAAGEGTPLQNSVNRLDVNDDGLVSPVDVLGVVNYLNAAKVVAQSEGSGNGHVQLYVDVNGDQAITALDALIIINFLNLRTFVQAESESVGSDDDRAATHRAELLHGGRPTTAITAASDDSRRRKVVSELPVARAREFAATPLSATATPHRYARLRRSTQQEDGLPQSWEILLDELAEDAALAQDFVPSV